MTISLKPIRVKDAAPFAACINDQDLIKKAYEEDFKYPFLVSDSVKYIRMCRRDKDNPEYSILCDGHFVGTLSFDITNTEPREYSIGYFIDRAYQGKGLATQAVKAAISIGFDKLGAKAILADVFADNVGSIRVLEKTGFRFLKLEEISGVKNVYYKLTKEDWDHINRMETHSS